MRVYLDMALDYLPESTRVRLLLAGVAAVVVVVVAIVVLSSSGGPDNNSADYAAFGWRTLMEDRGAVVQSIACVRQGAVDDRTFRCNADKVGEGNVQAIVVTDLTGQFVASPP